MKKLCGRKVVRLLTIAMLVLLLVWRNLNYSLHDYYNTADNDETNTIGVVVRAHHNTTDEDRSNNETTVTKQQQQTQQYPALNNTTTKENSNNNNNMTITMKQQKQKQQQQYPTATTKLEKEETKHNDESNNTEHHNSTIMTCNNHQEDRCCATWETNTDEWWTHHPDWEVSSENETGFCFSPISQTDRLLFNRRLYNLQWNGNCTNQVQAFQHNSGFGASTTDIVRPMLYAMETKRPFQMTKEYKDFPWMYSTNKKESWAYCPTKDMNCYFLPLSNCSSLYNEGKTPFRNKRRRPEDLMKAYKYLTRPKQVVRKKLWDMMQEDVTKNITRILSNKTTTPACTTMHVRRGDAAYPKPPFRRYAAVSEYIEAGNLTEGDTVLLLTDDQSTIDEALRLHPNYRWLYVERARHRGPEGGFNRHVPSHDPPLDLMFILLELKLATMCDRFVYGHSGLAHKILEEFRCANKYNPENFFYVDTEMNKKTVLSQGLARQRAQQFWKEFDEKQQKGTK